MNWRQATLAIVGLGCIGGSVALGLRSRGAVGRLLALDPNAAAVDAALADGVVDAAYTRPGPFLAAADALLVATPLSQVLPALQAVLPFLRKGTLLTDVGSSKARLVVEVEELLQGAHLYVGGHPMAGREQSGYHAADAQLLAGRPVVFTPTERTLPEALEAWSDLMRSIGANVLVMDPASHDHAVAYTSHLPYVVAAALALAVQEAEPRHPAIARLVATGFRDTTRVASGEARMSADMCIYNRQGLSEALRLFQTQLDRLIHGLENEQADFLDILLAAKTFRDRIVAPKGSDR